MRKLLATVALTITTATTSAAPVIFNPRTDAERQILATVLYRTVQCMREATENQLRAGLRDDNDIATGTAILCGGVLNRYMVTTLGMSQRDASTYLFAMGHAALDERTK